MLIKLITVLFFADSLNSHPLKEINTISYIQTLVDKYIKYLNFFHDKPPVTNGSNVGAAFETTTPGRVHTTAAIYRGTRQRRQFDYMLEYAAGGQMKGQRDMTPVFDFEEHERMPYWPGGDYVFERDMTHRQIQSTSPTRRIWIESTKVPTTWNPDCNQHCQKMFETRGLVCAQRFIQKRKEIQTIDLFGISWLALDWLVGWWFPWSDMKDVWEFRQFDDLCDLEYENCRNITHTWFPAYFGRCHVGMFRDQETNAQKILDFKMAVLNESTTPVYEDWMMFGK